LQLTQIDFALEIERSALASIHVYTQFE